MPLSLMDHLQSIAQMNAHPLDHLSAGYLQLGLFALLFGGLQIWWICSTLRKRDLARPLSEGEFRRTLARIWAKKS